MTSVDKETGKPTLEKKGYRIAVEYWVGNLGNHLIQISGALNVAQNTQSTLTLPKHPLIKLKHFDFTSSSNVNCNDVVKGRFFYQTDCFQFPVRYDVDRRRLFRDYLLDHLQRKTLRESLADLVSSKDDDFVGPDTLVINIRSGRDIFTPGKPAQDDYMQPPLSFYKRIIESHGYDDCLIVTTADRLNPCVDALLAWKPSIRIKRNPSVRGDLRTLLAARHLVMCHSSFSWCFALMSRNLEVLHQPETFRILGVPDLSIYTYHFENYIVPGEWTFSDAQRDLMLSHPIDAVTFTHQPAHDNVNPVPSAFW